MDLARRGTKAHDIASQVGVSLRTVQLNLKRAGVEPVYDRPQYFTGPRRQMCVKGLHNLEEHGQVSVHGRICGACRRQYCRDYRKARREAAH